DGSNIREIHRGFTNGTPVPTISADGSLVVMMAEIDGIGGVWTIRTDGTRLQLVVPTTTTRPDFYYAVISPVATADGEYKIAFPDYVGDQMDIWLVNLDGTALQNLTDAPDVHYTNLAWSIDATRIAARRSSSPSALMMMYELGLDQGGVVQITSETNLTPSGQVVSPIQPAWANTQDLLVVSAWNAAHTHRVLWLLDATAPGFPQQLTSSDHDDRFASFSPDDTRIVFDRTGSRNGIMELDGNGNVRRLTRHGGGPNQRRF
ncbi:MAG: TolB family protein, partial [Planctomycetota bacterium]